MKGCRGWLKQWTPRDTYLRRDVNACASATRQRPTLPFEIAGGDAPLRFLTLALFAHRSQIHCFGPELTCTCPAVSNMSPDTSKTCSFADRHKGGVINECNLTPVIKPKIPAGDCDLTKTPVLPKCVQGFPFSSADAHWHSGALLLGL